MKITVNPVKVVEDPINEVTSDKIFQARKIKDKNNNYLFDKQGIFSERIFGKFGKCNCGKLTRPGICPECDCRVLDRRNMPKFYIKFNFDLPNRSIDFEDLDKNTIELVTNLLYFKGFLYYGEYRPFDLKDDLSVYDQDNILFGKDAILSLGISEDWYNKNVHRIITIPHTSFRKITFQNDKYIIGPLNTLYVNMIRLNNKYDKYKKNNTLSIFNEINLRYIVCRDLDNLYDALYKIISDNKKSIVTNELKGQPETGMIRAVMTNNFSLNEDTLIIGKYFIETLYPKIYFDNTDKYGNTDIDAINKILADEEYLVLFNRQPTIGAKSIIAMKPVFSKLDSEQYVIQANPIIYDGLAADVDGDTLNVLALYTKEACEEAKKLLPSHNYIEGSNESIRNGMLEEFEYVLTLLGA